jgi:DNA polymerase III subunit epsilon
MNRSPVRCVTFDVETMGLFPAKGHEIIEIGAVAVNGDEMGEEFQSLICPTEPISEAANKVRGITAQMLVGQPKPEDVLPSFEQFIGNSTLVAHNADFDMNFLNHEFGRLGLNLNNMFPAHAGMNRAFDGADPTGLDVPRTRGDEPCF